MLPLLLTSAACFTYILDWIARRQEAVEDVPCGNTVAMVGLDQFITKNATLTNEKADDAHPIKAMKFSVSPVVSYLLEWLSCFHALHVFVCALFVSFWLHACSMHELVLSVKKAGQQACFIMCGRPPSVCV